jgi:hypothetical protein
VNHDPSLSGNEAGEGTLPGLDTTVPVSARIWNYWMGGKDYYQVDKQAGDEFAALFPHGHQHVGRRGGEAVTHSAVRMRGPSSVTAIVCSTWAARLPSALRTVQPSRSMR